MSSVSKLQGVDLAKENFRILQQLDSNADLRVDSLGKIYVQKAARSIFGGIFNGGGNLDVKRLERAKINAAVWGHLIPDIKTLQGKERLSESDVGMIQSMLDEIQTLREKNPAFESRMKELLHKMDKRLEELSCRYIKQKPSSQEPAVEVKTVPPAELNPPQDAKPIEPVLEEVEKAKEPPVQPVVVVVDQTQVLGEIKKVKELIGDIQQKPASGNAEPQSNSPEALVKFARAAASTEKEAEFPAENSSEPKGESGLISRVASTIGNGAYIGIGLGASVTVGALYAAKQVAVAPFYIGKTVLGTVLSPNLVQNCLGITNFSNAIEELNKSKVWVPDRRDGKADVAYTGPESVFEVIPRLRARAERTDEEKRAAKQRGEKEEYPVEAYIEIPEQRIEKSLEHIDWEHNPLFSRLHSAGSECIFGLMKLGFTVTAATMITLYFLGRYGNENNLCKNECNLDEESSLITSLWDALKQWYSGERVNWEECDSLIEQKQRFSENPLASVPSDWEKNNCNDNSLTNSCRGLQESYGLVREYLRLINENWQANYCDDERPKPILENLVTDMRNNPWKILMKFANDVDAAAGMAARGLSVLKEPAKATLRKLIDIGEWVDQNRMTAFRYSELLIFAGLGGQAEINRRSSTWLKQPLWIGLEIAAIASFLYVDRINAQVYGLGSNLFGRVNTFSPTETFGL